MAQIIKAEEFNNKISKGTVVVDFFATWCQPCSMLAPVIEELGQEMAGQAEFIKVDVDQSMDLASQYQIVSIPAMLIFKDGQLQDRMVGFLPKAAIKEKVEQYL